MERNMFCPICGHPEILRFGNNNPVGDFFCAMCNEEFELKSKRGNHGHIGATIADGAYRTMIDRISSKRNPHLMIMLHENWSVNALLMVPKFLFIPRIIIKRPALGPQARRAGWVGCKIAVGEIPESGKIHIVQNGQSNSVERVLSQYKAALTLQTNRVEARGWLLDVLKCIEEISSDTFTIEDAYAFSEDLKQKYPNNQFVKPKIRQQLQRLRDKGFLAFLGNGVYRKTAQLRTEITA